jgi:hypothetical protein
MKDPRVKTKMGTRGPIAHLDVLITGCADEWSIHLYILSTTCIIKFYSYIPKSLFAYKCENVFLHDIKLIKQ